MSFVLTAAVEAAIASSLRSDALQPLTPALSPRDLFFCDPVTGKPLQTDCQSGWTFAAALPLLAERTSLRSWSCLPFDTSDLEALDEDFPGAPHPGWGWGGVGGSAKQRVAATAAPSLSHTLWDARTQHLAHAHTRTRTQIRTFRLQCSSGLRVLCVPALRPRPGTHLHPAAARAGLCRPSCPATSVRGTISYTRLKPLRTLEAVQEHIRDWGGVVTSMFLPDNFRSFFTGANRTAVWSAPGARDGAECAART